MAFIIYRGGEKVYLFDFKKVEKLLPHLDSNYFMDLLQRLKKISDPHPNISFIYHLLLYSHNVSSWSSDLDKTIFWITFLLKTPISPHPLSPVIKWLLPQPLKRHRHLFAWRLETEWVELKLWPKAYLLKTVIMAAATC